MNAGTPIPPAPMLSTSASDASETAPAYAAKPPVSIEKPVSQLRSPTSRRTDSNGRRIDRHGSEAAASCSRRLAMLVSVVETTAKTIATAVQTLIFRT